MSVISCFYRQIGLQSTDKDALLLLSCSFQGIPHTGCFYRCTVLVICDGKLRWAMMVAFPQTGPGYGSVQGLCGKCFCARDAVLGDPGSWARCTQQADAVRSATRAQGARTVLVVAQPLDSPEISDERALQLCKQAGIDRRYHTIRHPAPHVIPAGLLPGSWASRVAAHAGD